MEGRWDEWEGGWMQGGSCGHAATDKIERRSGIIDHLCCSLLQSVWVVECVDTKVCRYKTITQNHLGQQLTYKGEDIRRRRDHAAVAAVKQPGANGLLWEQPETQIQRFLDEASLARATSVHFVTLSTFFRWPLDT